MSKLELAIDATTGDSNNPKTTATQAGFKPKLTLSTNISSVQLSNKMSGNGYPHEEALKIAARSQPAFNKSDLAAEGVLAAKNNNPDISYQAKKEDVEKAWENENKLLIAFTLIFATAILITYLVTRNKPLL